MYRIGQRVTVLIGGNVGTVEKVSTWAKEHDMLLDNILSVTLAPMGVVGLTNIVENDDVP